jgi:hypothetical protein
MTKKRHNGSSAPVSVSGEIRAADLDRGTFVLRLSDGARVRAVFSPAQEALITGALREHASRRLHLRGRGELQRNGKLKRVVSVKELHVKPAREKRFDKNARPIWEIAEEIAATVPAAEWEKLPTDLAANYKHYLYGAPKRK